MKIGMAIRVGGKVQGIWYRASARIEAQRLGLTGWVQNNPDGSVNMEAFGQEEALNSFLAWNRQGPPLAEVTRIEHRPIEYQDFSEFSIRR